MQVELREDARGYFTRVFCKEELAKAGIKYDIVQINQSLTKEKGTIRGLHYQIPPKSEEKIIRCVKGKIFDVVIDLRPESLTYRKWFSLELSDNNNMLFYIPKGFAHGFQTLTNDCTVEYFVSEYYTPDLERGVRWNDMSFQIRWPIQHPHISDKDATWTDFIV